MTKTVALRKLVVSKLKVLGCPVYYRKAPSKAEFPYITYSFDGINYYDQYKDDVYMLIDVWDKSHESITIDELADRVEEMFDYSNNHSKETLATFYKESRDAIADEDDSIEHRQIRIYISNYYVGG